MTNLASVTQRQLEQWDLRRDGDPIQGPGSMVSPVRTADGAPAVLKITLADAESEHEHLALRRWGGDGAVRLLSADPPRRAVLLERLRPQNLATLSDVDACEVVAGLYRRLHVPALPQLRTLTSYLEQWTAGFEALPRSAPIPHRLVEQAIVLGRELADQPAGSVVHGNLHYENVLAADREPWLAIGPRPMNGDPHYEVAPMLWTAGTSSPVTSATASAAASTRSSTRQTFDEERARAWVIVRVVRQATREPRTVTKYVALAKAVQD